MKKRTDKAIIEFFTELFGSEHNGLNDFEISVSRNKGRITIKVKQMYEYVSVNFEKMQKIANWFDTVNLDVDEWSRRGCDTCDYGSSYTKTFDVW